MTIAIPLLYLYRSETDTRKKGVLIGGIAAVISISNILRNSNGLPVLIITLLVLLEELIKRKIAYKSMLIWIIILLCTANLLSTTIPCYVADRWGVTGKENYNSSPWHSILIGMGYLENEYGLYYDDNSARDIIYELYPDVEYNSHEYYECCKEVALKIIAEDPVFVIKGLFAKLLHCLRIQMKYITGISPQNCYTYWWIFVGIGFEILLLVKVKRMKAYMEKYISLVIIGAEMAFLSMYTGVLAYPSWIYILGTLGGTGVVVALIFLTMGAEIIQYGKDKRIKERL